MGVSNQVITDDGAALYANAFTANRKIRFKGFQLSEGNASTSANTATMLATTKLNFDNPSQLHPGVDEYFLTTEELPKADPADAWDSAETYVERDRVRYNGVLWKSIVSANINNVPDASPNFWELHGVTNYILEVGLVIVPTQTSSQYSAKEIGLFSEELAVPIQWTDTQRYTAFSDYVVYNPGTGIAYWKSIQTSPLTWDVGTSYSAGQTVHYQNSGWTSLINGNVGNTPGVNPTIWAPLSLVPGADAGAFWTEVTSVGPLDDPLIPVDGTVTLFYYIVRDTNPLTISPTHSTVLRITFGLTQQQADLTIPWFDRGDVQEFAETQLSFVTTIESNNREIRDLAREVEALRLAIPPTP